MAKPVREYIHHEQPRKEFQGLVGIYCRRCGRELIRCANSSVRSVTMCQVCILKEQGIEHPEDFVLNQYKLSEDMNRIPVPVNDDGLEQGILMLYPEEFAEQGQQLLPSGG